MKAWGGVGEAYSVSYASLCAGTIDLLLAGLGPADGRRMLDVGAGTGDLIARASSRGWSVIGCEPEASMRQVAEGLHPALRIVEGSLPDLPFADDDVDAVTANFVLNHVPDPRRAARGMARVAVPGAPLAATVWIDSPSWFWRDVCGRAGITPVVSVGLAAEKDFARTVDGFAGMLADGGWGDVEVAPHAWTWSAAPQALWASAEGGVASAGELYAELDVDQRRRFRAGFDALCAELEVDGGVPLTHTAAVAAGRAL